MTSYRRSVASKRLKSTIVISIGQRVMNRIPVRIKSVMDYNVHIRLIRTSLSVTAKRIKVCVKVIEETAQDEEFRIRQCVLAENTIVDRIRPADCQRRLRPFPSMGTVFRRTCGPGGGSLSSPRSPKCRQSSRDPGSHSEGLLGNQSTDEDNRQTGRVVAVLCL